MDMPKTVAQPASSREAAAEPTVLGPLPAGALPFVRTSLDFAKLYAALCDEMGKVLWPNDP